MPIPPAIRDRLAAIKLVVFDFDGVMTDNSVLVREDGQESVTCNRSDGLGIGMLRDSGMPIVVLSAEENPVVVQRCKKLKIECTHGHKVKLPVLQKLLADKGVTPHEAAYVGNDVNDATCLRHVGLAIVVADAHDAVKPLAHAITTKPGGKGAVREIVDWFLEAKGLDPYGVTSAAGGR
jgi:3-deoxy-D-manno-octulosonate 8-phosphate phosphatase (KDO 8-P phosphatase)